MIFYKWNFGFKSELIFYDIIFTLQNYPPTSLRELSLTSIWKFLQILVYIDAYIFVLTDDMLVCGAETFTTQII